MDLSIIGFPMQPFLQEKNNWPVHYGKKYLKINPEKEGLEPWNDEHPTANGFEEHVTSILKKLESDYMEERLFAIFLISLSNKKETILSSKEVTKNNKFSTLENQYVSMVKADKKTDGSQLVVAHETAKILYEHHHPIGTVEAGLYLMWFSVFAEMIKQM